VHAELGEDVADVPVGGSLADEQHLGQLRVCHPLGQQGEHLLLPGGQAEQGGTVVGPGVRLGSVGRWDGARLPVPVGRCPKAERLCRDRPGLLGKDVAADPYIDTAGAEVEACEHEPPAIDGNLCQELEPHHPQHGCCGRPVDDDRVHAAEGGPQLQVGALEVDDQRRHLGRRPLAVPPAQRPAEHHRTGARRHRVVPQVAGDSLDQRVLAN
jgi:hypothetical protein